VDEPRPGATLTPGSNPSAVYNKYQ
jgi:hypothetical protein